MNKTPNSCRISFSLASALLLILLFSITTSTAIADNQTAIGAPSFWQYKDDKRVEFDIADFRADIEYQAEAISKLGAGIVIALAPDAFVMAGVNYAIRFPSRNDKPGNTAWLSIEEGEFQKGKGIPGRLLNGDEAWYRVNLGPTPRILMGKVYRFPNSSN